MRPALFHLMPALAAALAGGMAPSPATAQAATERLEPVVVTATRSEAATFALPASIDRIDGDALRAGRAQVNISERPLHD